jgi:membrane protein
MLDHRNPRDAAAISYFSFLALFPSVLILISVAYERLGRVKFDTSGIINRIFVLLPFTRRFLKDSLNQIFDPSTTFVLTCVLVVTWTSSWVFSIVENALNRAWDVPKRRTFWESRARSMAVVILGGSILLASVVVLALASPVTDEYIQDELIGGLWQSVIYMGVFFLAITVFACIFKIMPDRKVKWIEAFSGAIISALLWELGTYLFIRLVPSFDYERIYGKMSAVIALLAWVYTSNLIMLFGANFSAQLHRSEADRVNGAEKPADLQPHDEGPMRNVRTFPRSG